MEEGIEFLCPHCGKKTSIPVSLNPLGKKKKCKGCGRVFRLGPESKAEEKSVGATQKEVSDFEEPDFPSQFGNEDLSLEKLSPRGRQGNAPPLSLGGKKDEPPMPLCGKKDAGKEEVLTPFGRYQIKEEIGKGGMGKVYSAYDSQLARLVALKVLVKEEIATEKDVKRFYREARAMAHLDHPNIVRIYDIGEESGRHFFTMDLIEGQSLKALAMESKLSPKKIVEIMQKVGDAVHYAHRQGIIHRDLKPGNVLVGKKGEVKVLDFGLAKNVQDPKDAELTKPGAVLGTILYMPPEQAEGKNHEVDERSDVYSMGAILYELLTGQPIFKGATHYNLLYKILEKRPVRPSRIDPNIPKDLEKICLRCLEKRKKNRYPNACSFVDDLARFERGQALKSEEGFFSNLAYRMKRRKAVLTLSFLLFAFALASVFLFPWLYYKPQLSPAKFFQEDIALARRDVYFKSLTEEQWTSVSLAWHDYARKAYTDTRKKIHGLCSVVKEEIVHGNLCLLLGYVYLREVSQMADQGEDLWKKVEEMSKEGGEQFPEFMEKCRELAFNHYSKQAEKAYQEKNWEACDYAITMAMKHRKTPMLKDLKKHIEKKTAMPQDIWEKGWNKEKGWFDFTIDEWQNLPWEKQSECAALYQRWYAKYSNLPLEKTVKTHGATFDMVLIPPGKFWMGSPENEPDRETYNKNTTERRHRVTITKAFWIQKTECTQKQWKSLTGESPWSGDAQVGENVDYPATHVDLDDVRLKLLPRLKDVYGMPLSLPSEAQWEYACRGGTTSRFYWGNAVSEMGKYANVCDLSAKEAGKPKENSYVEFVEVRDPYAGIAPVGKLLPNSFGLYDMIGNVWEWCRDRYESYPEQDQIDPDNPPKGYVINPTRGGAWNSGLWGIRSAGRGRAWPNARGYQYGARFVLETMPDPFILEGEGMTILEKRGGDIERKFRMGCFGDEWRNDHQLAWTNSHVGDRLTLALPVEANGPYRLLLQFTKGRDYGKVQIYLNGARLGEVMDFYSAHVRLADILDLGTVNLQQGQNRLTFENCGSDEKAWKNYRVGLDYAIIESGNGNRGSKKIQEKEEWKIYAQSLQKIQPKPIQGAIEAERLVIFHKTGGYQGIDWMPEFGEGWSDNGTLSWWDGKPGDSLTLSLPLEKAVACKFFAQFTRQSGGAIVQMYLNDEKLGDPIDLYAPYVYPTGMLEMGVANLKKEDNRLTLKIVGRNEKATHSHKVCLDYIRPVASKAVGSKKATKTVIEGEALTVLEKTGGTKYLQEMGCGEGWSEESQLHWIDARPGDRLTLRLPVEKSGKYRLSLRLTKAPDYAIAQISLNGKKLGSPVDFYASHVCTTGDLDMGIQEFDQGDNRLVFEITGSNKKAIARHMVGLDCLTMEEADGTVDSGVQRKTQELCSFELGLESVKGAIEGESMTVLEKTGGTHEVQEDSQIGWSDGRQLFWHYAHPGDRLTLALPVQEEGVYQIGMQFTQARDFCIIQVHLNGKKLGKPIDLYAPHWHPTGLLDMGVVSLKPGENKLALEIVGAHPRAWKQYRAGLDCVSLRIAQYSPEKEARAFKMLQPGIEAQEKGQREKAIKIFHQVTVEFPASKAAKTAKKRLQEFVVEEITIPCISSDPYFSNVLEKGSKYWITAEGTWFPNRRDHSWRVDARYVTFDRWKTNCEKDGVCNYGLHCSLFKEDRGWGTYDTGHRYAADVRGEGEKIWFRLMDGALDKYSDNGGDGYHIVIYKTVDREEAFREIWKVCRYKYEDGYVLDMSHDRWCALSILEQQSYAAVYQQFYARNKRLPIEKIVAKAGATFVFRLVPPGRFWMGSPDAEKDRESNETRHRVLISNAYYMAKTEVTQEQWQTVMRSNPSHFKHAVLNAPVENVSWDDCQIFCSKTDMSLPTEAQWEYACRSGVTRPFNLGDNITPDQVNHRGARKTTITVGSLNNANAWGLYDMHGNVWEWCRDWDSIYPASDTVDPTGPRDGSRRVNRGGSWKVGDRYCRSANRGSRSTCKELGFRLCATLRQIEKLEK